MADVRPTSSKAKGTKSTYSLCGFSTLGVQDALTTDCR